MHGFNYVHEAFYLNSWSLCRGYDALGRVRYGYEVKCIKSKNIFSLFTAGGDNLN